MGILIGHIIHTKTVKPHIFTDLIALDKLKFLGFFDILGISADLL